MSSSLAQKLQLKPSQHLVLLNAPPGYVERLGRDLPGATDTAGSMDGWGAVLPFVNKLAEAERLVPWAIAAVRTDGLLWIACPKGTSGIKTDVNRDRLWEAIKPLGWLAIRQIALDDIWSAMRFHPAELVGT